MIDRFSNRQIFENKNEMYSNILEERDLKKLFQYKTALMKYPSEQELYKIQVIEHIWSVGDRYYKLANTYYGDVTDWWVIAYFNNKPTESHVSIGDVLQIPMPLTQILSYVRG